MVYSPRYSKNEPVQEDAIDDVIDETLLVSKWGDMMRGCKDVGASVVFVKSLESTSNDATPVPPRREPHFFLEKSYLSQTSAFPGYSLTFSKSDVPGIWRPLRGLGQFAVLLRSLRDLRAQQMAKAAA